MKILFFFLLLAQELFAQAPTDSRIKAFIFDFGEVIATIDRAPVIDYIAKTLKTNAKKDFSADNLYIALEAGEPFWKSYASSHGKTLPSDWMTTLNTKAAQIIQPLPGMLKTVSDLKKLGYRVALLSNTTKARSQFFKDQGYYAQFDPLILSWEVKLKKPNPKIYEIMLEKLNLSADQCVFIDNEAKNVQAARKLGIQGIHFKTPQQFNYDLAKIVSLNEKSVSKSLFGHAN